MPIALTDAIPLVEADGFTGRNNARDFRTQLLAGVLAPDAVGVGARPGVLPRRYITAASAFVDLRAIQLNTPGQAVQFYPGKAIVTRTGQGPYLVSQETTISNYPLDAADPTNPRIDLLYVRVYDQTIGDSSSGPHGPFIEHVNGDPAGSPVAPSVPVDALPIAQVLRPANVNTVTAGNITDLRKSASLLGMPRVMLPGDLLTDAGLFVSERRFRMATQAQITAGQSPFIEDVWCADSTWRRVTPARVSGSYSVGNIATNGFDSRTVTFPAGLFDVPPHITVVPGSGRLTGVAVSITATSADLQVANWTSATASANTVSWQAVAKS